MATAKKKVSSKCPGCGGNLLFSPNSQDLACEKCLAHVGIEKNNDIPLHVYQIGKNSKDNSDWQAIGRSFRCKSCGGQVSLSGLEITKICPYCGSTYVSEVESLPGLKPDCVIPFAFDKSVALQKFKEKAKKKKFLPGAFKKSLPESKIYGLYIPCFSFDADAYSTYKGVLEENYTTTDREGKTIVEIRSFPISGSVNLNFKNVVIEASQKMTQSELGSILPYRHNEAYKFDEGFLRGFYVEHYSDSLDESHDKARNVMNSEIRRNILSQYHYDRVRYLDIDSNYSNEHYLYKLLPVYKFEYTYKKKKYLTCMNGQTGELQNNMPKSGWKIFGLVLGILVPIILFVLLFIFIN